MVSKRGPNRKNLCIEHCYLKDLWYTLPDKVRNYISDLELSRVDQTGNVQEIASLYEQRDALVERVKELEQKLRDAGICIVD